MTFPSMKKLIAFSTEKACYVEMIKSAFAVASEKTTSPFKHFSN